MVNTVGSSSFAYDKCENERQQRLSEYASDALANKCAAKRTGSTARMQLLFIARVKWCLTCIVINYYFHHVFITPFTAASRLFIYHLHVRSCALLAIASGRAHNFTCLTYSRTFENVRRCHFHSFCLELNVQALFLAPPFPLSCPS